VINPSLRRRIRQASSGLDDFDRLALDALCELLPDAGAGAVSFRHLRALVADVQSGPVSVGRLDKALTRLTESGFLSVLREASRAAEEPRVYLVSVPAASGRRDRPRLGRSSHE
jgi:hypothetical protein